MYEEKGCSLLEKPYAIDVEGNQMQGVLTIVKDQAPFVIFSHGYNGTEKNLATYCSFLAEQGINSYRYDFLGGSVNESSQVPTEAMTIFTERRDLLSVINHFKDQAFIDSNQLYLFGASMGGLVSSLAAEIHTAIRGVFLMFPAFSVAHDWQQRYQTKEEIPRSVNFWGMSLGYDFFEVLIDFKLEEQLGNYTGPIYIIHGDKDDVVSHTVTDWVKPLYDDITINILTNEGHGFSKSGEEQTKQALLAFIRQHS
ncbi:hypothetical protein SAMN05720591_101209 [Halolactibacillus alkaliphilus]|nr:hypothetical protein SAMN05720591_101209 [Halolactibacillus alkaliphilus]